jgi:peptide subunit release factor 1 (eRF1)
MSSQIQEPLSTTIEEPLARLVAFQPTTLPVISVYLNTEPDQHGRDPDVVSYLQRELKSLGRTLPPSGPERDSFNRDVERILAYAGEQIKPAANGVAIFACSGVDDFFETIQLTAPLGESRVYVYNQPHLYQLARVEAEYPRYAAVLTDTNSARIFVFGLGQTLETEEIKGKKVHRVKVGGWSQARYQRRAENAHQQHAQEVVERLGKLVRDENVSRILIAGDPVIVPLLQEAMPQDLAALVEVVKLDTHASEQDVFRATLEALQQQEARSDVEKVQRLFEQYRARGLAVTGASATLEALANGQVDELLLSRSLDEEHQEQEIPAIVAPEIPDSSGGTESEEPRKALLSDLLVTKAKQTDAAIVFVEDANLLAPVGGVGAFLRWRT